MQSRRTFVLSTAAAGLALGMPRAYAADPWRSEFHAALAVDPWLRAFRNVESPAFAAQATVSGNWPRGLAGTLYRNGPAQHEVGDFRYRHWFDGDGMLQAWRLSETGVRHQGRLVETTKLVAETRAGRALYPTFASQPPDPKPVTGADVINVANISVLPHHGRLYALWEAGSPWEMDPGDLTTRGLHTFSPETAGVPFSAHPRVEPDGTLWNFGYASGPGLLVFWHIDAHGSLVKTGTVKVAPMSMPHDFVVTARYVVVLLPPLHYTPLEAGETFLDTHRWERSQPTRVLVLSKEDFSVVRWLELPAQWIFHFGNAWDTPEDVVHFDGASAADPSALLQTFREIMRGRQVAGAPTRHQRFRLDLRTGTAQQERMFDTGLETEFPVIDPRISARRNHRLVLLCADENRTVAHPLLNQLGVYDDRGERLQIFRYPDHLLPEEHLFVPAPGSEPESQGWVIGSALDVASDRLLLNVFDVAAVDAGPIATATLPYALPLGLHGKFVASAR